MAEKVPPPKCPTRGCGHELLPHCGASRRCKWWRCPSCKGFGVPLVAWSTTPVARPVEPPDITA